MPLFWNQSIVCAQMSGASHAAVQNGLRTAALVPSERCLLTVVRRAA